MADEKAPVVVKDDNGRVSSVILDHHVSADSPNAVQIPVEADGSKIDTFDHYAADAKKAEKPSK